MKIQKFGIIRPDEHGGVQINGFTFAPETRQELDEGIVEQNIMPAIIRYLSDQCKVPVIDVPLDQKSEMVVLQAIQKARQARAKGIE